MAMTFDPTAAGLPIVGPYAGEPLENAKHRRETLRNVRLGPGPQECIGITNRKYDCYFISMMQALLHHPRVAQFVRYHHIGPRLKSDGKENLPRHETEFGCAFCVLYDMFVKYWTRQSTPTVRQEEVNKRFVMILRRFNAYSEARGHEGFDQGEQHDATEAYNEFIRWLSLSGKSQCGVETADVVKALFQVETRQAFTCHNCAGEEPREGTESVNTMDLKFQSNEDDLVWSMDELVESCLTEEVSKRCNVCSTGDKESVDFTFTLSKKIIHFPELLCFPLILYSYTIYGEAVKLKHEVEIPAELNMNKYSDVATTTETINYELYAVVRHIGRGKTINQGHYVAHIKADDGTWALCDDDEVFDSSFEEATFFKPGSFPYMLFYARKYPADERAGVKQEDVEYELPSWMKSKISDQEDNEARQPKPGKTRRPRKGSKDGSYIPGEVEESEDEDIIETIETPDSPVPPVPSPITPLPSPVPSPAPKTKPSKTPKKTSDTPYKPPHEESSDDDTEIIPSPKTKTPERQASPQDVPSTEPNKLDYAKLRVVDLKKELTSRGISFGSKLRKAQLQALLVKDDKTKASVKDKTITKTKRTPKLKLIISYTSMRVVDLKAELKRRKIPFVSKLKKDELKGLLLADDAKRVGKGVTVEVQDIIELKSEPEKQSTSKKRSAEEPPTEGPALRTRSKRVKR